SEAQVGVRPLTALWCELMLYTAARPGEWANARWGDFNLDEMMIWTIPGRKKTEREWQQGHKTGRFGPKRRPITPAVKEGLDELRRRQGNPPDDAPVLPNPEGRPYHYSTLQTWLNKTFKWTPHIDAHGFRSTLRSWSRANGFIDELWKFQVFQNIGSKGTRN